MPVDTLRLPEGGVTVPEPKSLEVMPNAKPSVRSNMPVHKPDKNKTVPMPNSGAHLRSLQIPQEKLTPEDSTRQKSKR